jgi:A/G-specific adenine glycosylase
MTPGSLLDWYRVHGRAHLPWRQTRDPYRIVVSEFMLQQTQVDRVIPLYEAFIAAFPDFASLAAAEAGDAVRLWRGLGYNSRAMRLHALARAVLEQHGGKLPSDREALLALPGIGPYTASAVRAFAFELDDVALDTNIRRIAHRTGFGLEYPSLATDAELDARARAALEPGTAHDWNRARAEVFALPVAPRLHRRTRGCGATGSARARRYPPFTARIDPVRTHDAILARPHHRSFARRPARRDALDPRLDGLAGRRRAGRPARGNSGRCRCAGA